MCPPPLIGHSSVIRVAYKIIIMVMMRPTGNEAEAAHHHWSALMLEGARMRVHGTGGERL
jgi:hypothetical protein